ncbi:reverse transcriptase domain-containing protein [Psychrobacter sp. Ps6]|uniref:reverse transcriptase domain-containing protein n=1 Tax=Psychrobacter sp. Ps6 TaxID=2790960 RepID=UPI001EE07D1F|nr:reverse transcriptase domain-containing protein [Psychrobacter sp. Ps6]
MTAPNNQQTDYISSVQTMTSAERQWQQLWQNIEDAGGRYQYIQQQMIQHGFMVERKPIDNMTPKERERYKKALKKEAAEEKNLKKMAWQAYKAQHIVYLGRHIYWSDDTSIDKWDIKDASNRLIENKLPLINKHTQLADAVNLSVPQLKALCYQREVATNIPYTHFTINKRNGTPRQIWSPIPRLKFVQRWILENILNNLTTHGAAHGFVRGKSIVTNAAVHSNSALLIKLDVKDFFPSVHWRRVKGVFRHAGYPEQIATLLALLCTESPRQMVQQNGKTYYVALSDRALPQGAPTSPALTNIVCLNLDRRLTGLADKMGLRYSRYADDLTFSLPANSTSTENATQPSDHNQLIGQLLGSVHKILREEGFILNGDKTRIIRMGNQHTVTGMVVNGEGVPRVPRKIKRMLRAALHNLDLGQSLKNGETIDTLSGYAAWIASAEPELGQRYLAQIAELAQPASA